MRKDVLSIINWGHQNETKEIKNIKTHHHYHQQYNTQYSNHGILMGSPAVLSQLEPQTNFNSEINPRILFA